MTRHSSVELAAQRTPTRLLRRLTRAALGYGIAAFAVLQVVVLTPLVPRITPPGAYEPKYDISNELRGWPEVASAVRALDPARRPVLGAFYTQCSQLAFALSRPDDPAVRCVSPEIDDFDLWHGRFTLPDTGALFVTDNRFERDPEALVPGARVNGPVIRIEIERGGRWVRRFYIYDLKPRRRVGLFREMLQWRSVVPTVEPGIIQTKGSECRGVNATLP